MADEPRLMGRIWWCEDYVCDCTLPEIVLVIPPHWENSPVGGWRYERVWEGTFVSGPGEDRSMQTTELECAARVFGLVSHPDAPHVYTEATR